MHAISPLSKGKKKDPITDRKILPEEVILVAEKIKQNAKKGCRRDIICNELQVNESQTHTLFRDEDKLQNSSTIPLRFFGNHTFF